MTSYQQKQLESLTSNSIMSKLIPRAGFVTWCQQINLDNKPFSFTGHDYLMSLYDDSNHHIIIRKAAQMGFSTFALLVSVHGCIYKYENGVLYLLATRGDVTEFSKGKLNKLIVDNPVIKSSLQETDSATLKKLNRAFLYFRGSRVRAALKSITVDMLVVDEFDEHDPKQIDLAGERLSHSEHKIRIDMSTATLPDYGIELLYQQSDQKRWAHKCSCCNKWNILEEHFPECLMEINKPVERGGEVIKLCYSCREELKPKVSVWVKARLDKDLPSGYYISQLNSPMVTPGQFLLKYKQHVLRTVPVLDGGVPNPTEFWNSKMGTGYVDAKHRLTKEEVWECCGDFGMENQDIGPCSMGVDQGDDFHVVIGTKRFGKPRIIYLGVHKEWGELDHLVKRYNVRCCVVDAMPEKRAAKAFLARVAKNCSGWINFYIDNKKTGTWYEDKHIVECDRTEILDDSHNQLLLNEVVLPRRSDVVDMFATHCHNIAKKLQENLETGSKVYTYVRLNGPDHFRHAFNYESLARTRIGVGIGGVVEGADRTSTEGDW